MQVGDMVRYFADIGDPGVHGVVVAIPWAEESDEYEDETMVMTEVLFDVGVVALCVDDLEVVSEGG